MTNNPFMPLISGLLRMLFLCMVVVILLWTSSASALAIDPKITQLDIKKLLEGEGVEIKNLSIVHGEDKQIALFSDGRRGSPNLGIAKGLVLSTGIAKMLASTSPNQINKNSAATKKLVTDQDLRAIIRKSIYDPVIIEFDLVPSVSNITVNFVFGSDEYDRFVGSAYVDGYGFFISGPGIHGAYQKGATNIAVLPDGDRVSTNFINGGHLGNLVAESPEKIASNYSLKNSDYFITNLDQKVGRKKPRRKQPQRIALNGWTKPVRSRLPVIPGKKYHVKIAIADGNDPFYDSAVFIENFKSVRQLSGYVVDVTPDSDLTYEQSFPDTRVILFNSNGAYLDETKTDSRGHYVFEVEAGKAYSIAVDSASLKKGGVQPEQTWSSKGGLCIAEAGVIELKKAAYCFGGKQGNMIDDLSSRQLDKAKHVIKVTKSDDDSLNLDFGFSYDVVTNVNDSDQGSFRQFITNANAGEGSGKMLFTPAVKTPSNGYWTLKLQSALDTLTKEGIELNGKASELAPFKRHSGNQGYSGNLIQGAGRPDFEIIASGDSHPLLTMARNGQKVQHFAFKGNSESTAILVHENVQAAVIRFNYFGDSILSPSLLPIGVQTGEGSDVTIEGNSFSRFGKKAIQLEGNGKIKTNVIENTPLDNDIHTGIDLSSNSLYNRKIVISGNTIKMGVDNSGENKSSIAINGSKLGKVERLQITKNPLISGGNIRLATFGNKGAINVSDNEFSHRKSMIVIKNGDQTLALNNKITKNAFILSGSTGKAIPIDLVAPSGSWEGDGASANTGGYQDSLPNRGIDRPIFTKAFLHDDGFDVYIEIEGFIQKAATGNHHLPLEFYKVKGSEYKYLEGQRSKVVSSVEATYSDPVSGKKITQTQFKLKLKIGSQPEGQHIAAIAIDNNGNTSEFSPPIKIAKAGTLNILVWKDKNKDGVHGSDEETIEGVNVKLSRIDGVMQDVLIKKTNTQGAISVTGLFPGEYNVEVLPNQPALKGLTLGTAALPQPITLKSGETRKVLFGYINAKATLSLTPNHHRSVTSGIFVSFIHRLTGSGNVTLKTEWQDDQKTDWPVTLTPVACEESENNAEKIPAITNQLIMIKENQPVCLKAHFFVPANTPYGLNTQLGITATMTDKLSGEEKEITASATDYITVTDSHSGNLMLNKTVQKVDGKGKELEAQSVSNQATPGDILRYSIHYTNTGANPITEVIITDQTPPFTALHKKLVCEKCNTNSFLERNEGYRGELIWPLKEPLQPGKSGSVSYDVKIE